MSSRAINLLESQAWDYQRLVKRQDENIEEGERDLQEARIKRADYQTTLDELRRAIATLKALEELA